MIRVKILLLFSVVCANLNAQHIAFDGNRDNRSVLNYGFIGENRGIAISFDRGISDYLSFTTKLAIVGADSDDFINFVNYSWGLRFHFVEVLNYGEPNDLYAGVDLGSSTSGFHVGYLRQLTRKLGVQVEAYYGFIGSFAKLLDLGVEDVNHFKNKPRIYIGLVLN